LIKGIKAYFNKWSNVSISKSAEIRLNKSRDTIGEYTVIGNHAVLSSENGGSIQIGEKCEIGYGSLILTYGGNIKIGRECSFNPYCVIYGHGGLNIGNYVRIAAHTIIIPANHKFNDKLVPITQQGMSQIGITIEDDVWIGAGVKILDGVRIAKGAVIAAGAVVNKDVSQFSIFGGVPAKKIGERG